MLSGYSDNGDINMQYFCNRSTKSMFIIPSRFLLSAVDNKTDGLFPVVKTKHENDTCSLKRNLIQLC